MADYELFMKVVRLYADYAAVVDAKDWDAWVDFFVDDCEYKVQPRENYEKGYPLATMWYISRDMLKDRAYGISETLFHEPYYQRHVVGLPRILSVSDGVIESEANYSVFRTKYDGVSTVFNVGRYFDKIHLIDNTLKFQSRLCVYDSEMIPNSIIYPI